MTAEKTCGVCGAKRQQYGSAGLWHCRACTLRRAKSRYKNRPEKGPRIVGARDRLRAFLAQHTIEDLPRFSELLARNAGYGRRLS